ncbi:SDR family oxidoreductase [Pedobacter heparinus]|uniref:SDR family NAD(P)-dependent oxidoreductase n=1 Tax=Pedobacter heparinus TaxID=984 RepID=UPI00292FA5BC|nr:SDR family oxidoreductase [Pedobacter heparinus]
MILKNKIAVIYGGSGAIGGAVARVFAREGAKVYIAARSQEGLDVVAKDITGIGGQVETALVDAFDQQAVDRHAQAIAQKEGSIDILLNAVSVQHDQGTYLENLSMEEFMRPVNGFLKPLFITSKAVAPYMGGKRPGVILTLTTPGSKEPAPGVLGHCVVSAGTEAFSRVLAAEMASKNVRVVCLRPHAISDAPAAGSYTKDLFKTHAEYKQNAAGQPISEWLPNSPMAQSTLLKRLPTLSEVAETAAFVASEGAGAMTGAIVNLSCGALVD